MNQAGGGGGGGGRGGGGVGRRRRRREEGESEYSVYSPAWDGAAPCPLFPGTNGEMVTVGGGSGEMVNA